MTEFITYFLVGGLVVALTAFYGTRGHGLLAAFIAMFPCVTVLTFLLIHRRGGTAAVSAYAKGFLYVVPPWLLYVLAVALLCDRIGIWWALGLGIGLYVAASVLLMQWR
jgi:uncharacterized membrane protein (GlpM family)